MRIACCAALAHAAALGGDAADEAGAIAAATRALRACPTSADMQRHGCIALAALAARAPLGCVPVARSKGAATAAAAALTWACGESAADNPIVADTRARACQALCSLAALPGCRREACAAGALEALLRLLRTLRLDAQVQDAGDKALLALITDDVACQKRALALGALHITPKSAHPSRKAVETLLRGCVADGQSAAAADADAAAAALLAELDAESAAASAAQHKRKAKQQQKKQQAQHADAAAAADDGAAGASCSSAAGAGAQASTATEAEGASHAADGPSGSSDGAVRIRQAAPEARGCQGGALGRRCGGRCGKWQRTRRGGQRCGRCRRSRRCRCARRACCTRV
jgi:hypothetical protein